MRPIFQLVACKGQECTSVTKGSCLVLPLSDVAIRQGCLYRCTFSHACCCLFCCCYVRCCQEPGYDLGFAQDEILPTTCLSAVELVLRIQDVHVQDEVRGDPLSEFAACSCGPHLQALLVATLGCIWVF